MGASKQNSDDIFTDFKWLKMLPVKPRILINIYLLLHVCDSRMLLSGSFKIKFSGAVWMSQIWFTAEEQRTHHLSPSRLWGIGWMNSTFIQSDHSMSRLFFYCTHCWFVCLLLTKWILTKFEFCWTIYPWIYGYFKYPMSFTF